MVRRPDISTVGRKLPVRAENIRLQGGVHYVTYCTIMSLYEGKEKMRFKKKLVNALQHLILHLVNKKKTWGRGVAESIYGDSILLKCGYWAGRHVCGLDVGTSCN